MIKVPVQVHPQVNLVTMKVLQLIVRTYFGIWITQQLINHLHHQPQMNHAVSKAAVQEIQHSFYLKKWVQ